VQIVRALEGDVSLEDLKEGMIKSSGHTSAYTSSSGSEYDTKQYNADMMKFRMAIMSSQEFGDSSELPSKEMGRH
jgi:interleukin-1 receptor-associated kinase 1